jgi:hypothetical protein
MTDFRFNATIENDETEEVTTVEIEVSAEIEDFEDHDSLLIFNMSYNGVHICEASEWVNEYVDDSKGVERTDSHIECNGIFYSETCDFTFVDNSEIWDAMDEYLKTIA